MSAFGGRKNSSSLSFAVLFDLLLRPLESFFRREFGSATSFFFALCLTVASLALLSKLTLSIRAKDSSGEAFALINSEDAEKIFQVFQTLIDPSSTGIRTLESYTLPARRKYFWGDVLTPKTLRK